MWVKSLRWHADKGWRTDEVPASTDLVLYFGPAAALEASGAAGYLSARFPKAIVMGCSTASGILDLEIDESGVVGVACGFRDTRLRLVEATASGSSGSAVAGRMLGEALRGDGLAGAFVLSDGVHVNGGAITSAIVDAVGPAVPVSGGLAGDGACFVHTVVGAGTRSGPGLVAALGFYGPSVRLKHSSAGGWDPFGPRRWITRSEGCLLRELDGGPALDLYKRYLGDEAAGLPGSALLYPLLVWDPDNPAQATVRTVLAIDHDTGAMRFAGDVPQGWRAQLMRGNIDRLVDAAAEAGRGAAKFVQEAPEGDCLALLVSCVGRRILLGQRTAEEILSVKTALGSEVRTVGFYSHGEIVPNDTSCHAVFQNQTMAVTLLTEAP